VQYYAPTSDQGYDVQADRLGVDFFSGHGEFQIHDVKLFRDHPCDLAQFTQDQEENRFGLP